MTTTQSADDPFEPLRAWWYKGQPLPSPGSKAAQRMAQYYAEHPDDPDAMFWTGVAATNSLVKTNRTNQDLALAAAAKGQPTAMARIGRAYLLGEFGSTDVEKGLSMLRKSLELGESDAALELGRHYARTTSDEWPLSDKYLHQALAMGNIRAHYSLFELYQKQRKTPEALAALEAGANAGDEACMAALAEAYRDGKLGAPCDPKKVLMWLHKGAERGKPAMARELVKCIVSGYGGLVANENNLSVARMLLQKSAAARDPESVRMLAKAYLDGELGFAYDPRKGMDLLREASDDKDAAATFELGRLYIEGLLVPRDLDHAKILISAAAAAGSKPAELYLRKLNDAATSHPTTRP